VFDPDFFFAMDSHLPTGASELVDAFKALPLSPRLPIEMIDGVNTWHFDIRYSQLEPPGDHILFLFQSESLLIHSEPIPCDDNLLQSVLLFFPENAKDAAPGIVKALMHAFVHGLRYQRLLGDAACPAFAPWKFSSDDNDIANEVGKECKRLGVGKELWNVNISSQATIRAVQAEYELMVAHAIRFMGRTPETVASIPQSLKFKSTDVPGQYDPEQHSTVQAYSLSVSRIGAPSPRLLSGKISSADAVKLRLEDAKTLLRTTSSDLMKHADAGNPFAAMDYGIR
jgi:hypothetical protein